MFIICCAILGNSFVNIQEAPSCSRFSMVECFQDYFWRCTGDHYPHPHTTSLFSLFSGPHLFIVGVDFSVTSKIRVRSIPCKDLFSWWMEIPNIRNSNRVSLSVKASYSRGKNCAAGDSPELTIRCKELEWSYGPKLRLLMWGTSTFIHTRQTNTNFASDTLKSPDTR